MEMDRDSGDDAHDSSDSDDDAHIAHAPSTERCRQSDRLKTKKKLRYVEEE
eukprot:CAMPEP_0202734346 /NCGR_PEP_ID=MMETSP1385-20130828/188638_1 /ASSEMBLY_ACC=CAM_ASM_000861 /TAXON_ID=933848 /ORGANISM="Elphidium margaritaceum" /LENGTH=50 /DNA_ID=CAMNT_0049400705 /DNA_START=522 /DNA_END=674 /DNA_ORIENTATION=-